LRRHLATQVGTCRRVLTERGGTGRTEQFTPVRLASPMQAGLIVDLTIDAHDGVQLLAA
jgi:threonylcarbamoyladenosine tRNA methylthiotransferase MtaB